MMMMSQPIELYQLDSKYTVHRRSSAPPKFVTAFRQCYVSKRGRLKGDWCRQLRQNFALLTPPPCKNKGGMSEMSESICRVRKPMRNTAARVGTARRDALQKCCYD